MTQKKSSKKRKIVELNAIEVRGAREHNLKNVHINIPKKNLVVVTGVSGSGKSSLAFDTIYAEGQRRYVESLSSYARQFLGQMEKPHFDTIRGLSPTIAIEQKAASKNPRSTVGTITEVYDYLRVFFARLGVQYCPSCHKKVGKGDPQTMVGEVLNFAEKTKIYLLAPIVENRKGEHKDKFEALKAQGFQRVRIDGVIHLLDEVQALSKNKKHNIEVVVDRMSVAHTESFRKRVLDSIEQALNIGQGRIILHVVGREDRLMSEKRACCGMSFPDLEPALFSFNSPQGMCEDCHGLGYNYLMDVSKVIPDEELSIREGAVLPWAYLFQDGGDLDNTNWNKAKLLAMEEQWGIDFDTPWKKIPKKKQKLILYGATGNGGSSSLDIHFDGENGEGSWSVHYEGLLNSLMRKYKQTKSESMKTWYSRYLSSYACKTCCGKRLKDYLLWVKVKNKSIMDICALNVAESYAFFADYKLVGTSKKIADELLKEIQSRLKFLVNVGLDYLSLDRKGPTLSGGEAQRIRLAGQIGQELTGVLYVLDEPSIGLHQRDNQKLLNTLMHLRDIGNTLLVVEHDEDTIRQSDWVIDVGPGAGPLGGQIVAEGEPKKIEKNKASLTGKYLRGDLAIVTPSKRRSSPGLKSKDWLTIKGASQNNLRNIDVKIPLGLFTCITGVSGAGKSTLINQILFPALQKTLHHQTIGLEIGAHKSIEGLEAIDKVINIDQKPIGRTPRSNPATYTKVFDFIRDLFAMTGEARARGYKKGRFSFNVKGGRCEHCEGDGVILVEMHFLADVHITCEVCKGKRFNQATLEVKYKNQSIADVLDMSVFEASKFFTNHPKIAKILDTLMDVGLSYIKLGQAATTLSGGEAQRIKLARELAKRDTGRTLYILDEPTTGLHFDDINKLLSVLDRLVGKQNTVLVIEHNLDVIKTCDWVIDMGPEGGSGGGMVVASGTPEQVAKVAKSHTGKFLKKIL